MRVTENNADRAGGLDSLRGLAAMMVVVYHYLFRVAQDPNASFIGKESLGFPLVDVMDLGRLGVVVFFLISGYVIPFSISGRSDVPTFFVKRFFRLYPIYWFALAVIFVVDLALRDISHGWPTVLANLTMLPSFFARPPMSGIYWTLSIELIFYFLAACVVGFGLVRPWLILAAAFSLLGATLIPQLIKHAGWGGSFRRSI